MSNFIINGGKTHRRDHHKHRQNPAPCMYACLLTDEESTLTDVPRIEEVARTIEVLRVLVQTEWIEEHTLKITPQKTHTQNTTKRQRLKRE